MWPTARRAAVYTGNGVVTKGKGSLLLCKGSTRVRRGAFDYCLGFRDWGSDGFHWGVFRIGRSEIRWLRWLWVWVSGHNEESNGKHGKWKIQWKQSFLTHIIFVRKIILI